MPDQITLQEAREAVAKFMEPAPERHTRSRDSSGGFWRWIGVDKGDRWEVDRHGWTLDRLREIEERLTQMQAAEYDHLLYIGMCRDREKLLWTWHADASRKTLALAAVIGGAR